MMQYDIYPHIFSIQPGGGHLAGGLDALLCTTIYARACLKIHTAVCTPHFA